MFSIHDLAALVAVADGGSVRQAAIDLARTQPAITQAIQRLEDAVGFPLLDRSGYRAKPTPLGELFLKRARIAVKQARDLKSYANLLAGGSESQLRLAVHGSLCPTDWLPLVAHLPQQFPDTVIDIQTGEGDSPLRKLVTEEADLAIAVGPATDKYVMDINRQRLGEIEFVFVIQASRLSANLEDDLKRIPHLVVTDFDDPHAAGTVGESIPYWRVSDHKTKVAMIAAGLGWGAVPRWLVASTLADGSLASFHYRGFRANICHTLYLCHWRQMPLGPVASSIWQRGTTADS